MSVFGYSDQWFKPPWRQFVVSLSKTLNPHCFIRLSCEMSTRRGHPREGCLFSAMNSLERIALKNQRIFSHSMKYMLTICSDDQRFFQSMLSSQFSSEKDDELLSVMKRRNVHWQFLRREKAEYRLGGVSRATTVTAALNHHVSMTCCRKRCRATCCFLSIGLQAVRHHLAIRMEVASSRPDYLPTLSAAKTSNISLLVKHHILAIDEAS